MIDRGHDTREVGIRQEVGSRKREKSRLVRSEINKIIAYFWQVREQTDQTDGEISVFTSSDPKFL